MLVVCVSCLSSFDVGEIGFLNQLGVRKNNI
jgi:hypothetical protein